MALCEECRAISALKGIRLARVLATHLNGRRNSRGVTVRVRQTQAWWTVAALMIAIGAWTLAAQAPAVQQARDATAHVVLSKSETSPFPAPANLKVLPKTMTGQQVHDLMEEWSRDLGAQCDACHTIDHNRIGPDGRPVLNFADDSKEMKSVSRTMYTMTEQINTDYIAKVHGSGVPVSCGMCHRGEVGAEPYAPQKPVVLPESEIRAVSRAAACADQPE